MAGVQATSRWPIFTVGIDEDRATNTGGVANPGRALFLKRNQRVR